MLGSKKPSQVFFRLSAMCYVHTDLWVSEEYSIQAKVSQQFEVRSLMAAWITADDQHEETCPKPLRSKSEAHTAVYRADSRSIGRASRARLADHRRDLARRGGHACGHCGIDQSGHDVGD